MAYRIRLFGRCADPVAHHACEELLTDVVLRDPLIREVRERHNGLGWVSIDLSASRPTGPTAPILVEVNTRPDVLAACLDTEDATAHGVALTSSNVLVELTLSGEPTDWQTVSAIWHAGSQLWSAIPWDEASGFDISLDDL